MLGKKDEMVIWWPEGLTIVKTAIFLPIFSLFLPGTQLDLVSQLPL